MIFSILITLLMFGFFVRNIYATYNYHQYAKDAVEVFDDTRPRHKVGRFVSLGFMLAMIAVDIVLYVNRSGWTVAMQICSFCVIIVFAMYTFVPYTHGRWVITKDGIFLYNYNTFVPWSDMISVRITGSRKDVYLQIELLKEKGNLLKKSSYPMLIPKEKAEPTRNLIRDFIELEDKERIRRHKSHLVRPGEEEE